ncbi:hypothetical protein BJ912DRAFT_430258 [Pholiota molesta]|nr:hypothetical protein BJ912DRAFT_430258 [Pholiota molesta]
MGIFQFFDDTSFKLVKTRRPFFCQSLALVRISRQMAPKDSHGQIIDLQQMKRLNIVIAAIREALVLTQCNYKSDRAIRDRLENAKRCVKEYVKEYINQMTIRFVENPVPSAAFHVWLTCNFLIKSYEETLLAFENATQGDHGVDERIKMIDTRTDEILQEYEQLQQTGPQNIELELYFWNTKLPAEQVPPVPDSKSRNLFIKAGKIDPGATFDILLCRISGQQVQAVSHREFSFDLTRNPHFYAKFPSSREAFNSNVDPIKPYDFSKTLGSLKEKSVTLHIISDRKFPIYSKHLPYQCRDNTPIILQSIGNMWPITGKEDLTVVKKLSGSLFLIRNFSFDWEDFWDPIHLHGGRKFSHLEILGPTQGGQKWLMEFVRIPDIDTTGVLVHGTIKTVPIPQSKKGWFERTVEKAVTYVKGMRR